MAQVTSPIILDSTGQQIHSDLQQIKNVLTTPSAAADITFDNTGTGMQADDVQDAITELKSNLTELIVIEEIDFTLSQTIGANTTYYYENTIPTKVGYKPYGIVGNHKTGSGNGRVTVSSCEINSETNAIGVNLSNTSTSSSTVNILYLYILWIKDFS